MDNREANTLKVGEDTRFGFVAVIGAPNAGKSTLVNALVGAKVTIVSRKVQTTRMIVRGIVVSGASQIVLVDTPGIFQPRRRLDKAMVNAAWSGASEADAIVVVVDATRGRDQDTDKVLNKVKDLHGPKYLVLNKVDRLAEKTSLLPLIDDIAEVLSFEATYIVSALTGDGIGTLRSDLALRMPAGPWHFSEEDVSDLPMRLLAAEITREKIYNRLHQELPYATTVETTGWKELKGKSVRVEQTIYVEQDGQKKILIGRGGQTVKSISSDARAELAEIVGRPVHLFLFVKVRKHWSTDPERYRMLGLDFLGA
ncbi:MAG: GTPase Era [Hyphomicrobiaceae bacterium]